MPAARVKPFLISKNDHGDVLLTARETRFNSQGYPWVIETPVAEKFKSAAAARAYAIAHLGAQAGEFSTT